MKKKALNSKYWKQLKSDSPKAGITLDNTISDADFETYGNRLADRQCMMFESCGTNHINNSCILDVGCGVGRIAKPFSTKFKKVVGIDINKEILDEAEEFTEGIRNVEFVENDGRSIPFSDNTFDYVFSGGVLQHIPDIDIIVNYFAEGLRVLKDNGILNYSIMVWMTLRQGGIQSDRTGAQIRARDIQELLNKSGHELVKIYHDEKDPLPHFNIIIKKLSHVDAKQNIQNRKLNPLIITENYIEKMDVRTGIFEDLKSYSNLRMLWEKKDIAPITFFKQPSLKPIKQPFFKSTINRVIDTIKSIVQN